jgi:hypothetical protein
MYLIPVLDSTLYSIIVSLIMLHEIPIFGGQPTPYKLVYNTHLSDWHLYRTYSARKAITLIVEVAYAGGAHMILVVLTVSLVPSA